MLKKNVSEYEMKIQSSEEQIEKLTFELEKYSGRSVYTNAGDVASLKIVELSKKLREKSSELEIAKTKCSKFEKKIFELQNEKSSKGPAEGFKFNFSSNSNFH